MCACMCFAHICISAPSLSHYNIHYTYIYACTGKKERVLYSPTKHTPRQPLFTDLSVAGLPAELKHITQRRKRKQP